MRFSVNVSLSVLSQLKSQLSPGKCWLRDSIVLIPIARLGGLLCCETLGIPWAASIIVGCDVFFEVSIGICRAWWSANLGGLLVTSFKVTLEGNAIFLCSDSCLGYCQVFGRQCRLTMYLNQVLKDLSVYSLIFACGEAGLMRCTFYSQIPNSKFLNFHSTAGAYWCVFISSYFFLVMFPTGLGFFFFFF